ncbi:MAG TPA: terminase small subunit [Lysobacter sp.]
MANEIIDQQRAFAEAYVLGNGNATQAAIAAGYSPVSARQTASRLLHTPHVQDAIRRAQAHALRGRLASKARGVLEKILDDDGAPAGVRVDAAKTVLDRAGFAAARSPEPDALAEQPLHAMGAAELEAFIRKEQRALDVLRAHAGDVAEG